MFNNNNKDITTQNRAFDNSADQWRLRFAKTLNPVRPSTPSSNLNSNFRMFSSAAASLHGRLNIADDSKKAFLLNGSAGKRFFSSSSAKGAKNNVDWEQIQKVLLDSSAPILGWLRRHKLLSFCIFATFSFGSLQWIPVSERMHMSLSTDKVENVLGGIIWEEEAMKNRARFMGPDSPESIRVVRVLRDILQATNQTLGLKNDFSGFQSMYQGKNCRGRIPVAADCHLFNAGSSKWKR
ncbi:OLC1v1038965C1 [Oldenlandia corymbosa var. corymbosa]|uniref:OLC1v1038965C1 n=1 Tax=Oldenlandia corymbosa var. corymbosa TaxID=529605 RepID=A0AAV1D1N3_OLDCO|nr:OLC1v1038965C1 [Oldenlandia corymbosa var. corymbosa]